MAGPGRTAASSASQPAGPERPYNTYTPTTPPPRASAKKHREGWRSVLSTLTVLIAAPLIALFLTAYVFQSYQVDGPSMETSLQNNDRLIVWKMERTWARLTGHDYVPQRGDVVIFNKSGLSAYGQQDTKQLIKRVIALPGERVVVKDGKITVYNRTHPDGFDPDAAAPYGTVITTTPGERDLTVPEGTIYVCGDNRVNSLDSRTFGPIPLHDVVGKLALRIFPFDKTKLF